MKDIVITGMGIVSPAGVGKANFWRHIREGRSFISPIHRFDASLYPSRIAGQVKELEPIPENSLNIQYSNSDGGTDTPR